jgi:DNA-directed RNA polymerase II subunit RPB7
MFFVKDEERTITLHPSFFGPNVKKYLEDRLKEDVEGNPEARKREREAMT